MQPAYYAILPANVRYDKNLKPMEKIMFAEITALANKDGYCSASNSYFAKLYEKSNETISRWISNLEKQGYVKVVIDTKKGNQRRIYPIDKKINTIDEKINTLLTEKSRPIDENVKQNNINTILQEDNNKNINIYSDLEKFLSDLQIQTLMNDLKIDEEFVKDLIFYRDEIEKPIKTTSGLRGLLKDILETSLKSRKSPQELVETMKENEWKTIKYDYLAPSELGPPKNYTKKDVVSQNMEAVRQAIEMRKRMKGAV